MTSLDARDDAEYKRARDERRNRAAIERQVAEQLRTGTLTAPPKGLHAIPGIETGADVVRYLEQVYAEQTATVEADLTGEGLDYELPAVRLEVACLWQAVRYAVRRLHPAPPLTPDELGSLVEHLARYLTLGIEAQLEAAQARQLYYQGRADNFVREWQRTALQRRREALTDEARKLLYGDETDALDTLFGGHNIEDIPLGGNVHEVRYRLPQEEA